MVSTLDFESSDPSSNLGGTSQFCDYFLSSLTKNIQKLHEIGFQAKTCKKINIEAEKSLHSFS